MELIILTATCPLEARSPKTASIPGVYDWCDASGADEWPSCMVATNGGEILHGLYHVAYQNPDTGASRIKRPIFLIADGLVSGLPSTQAGVLRKPAAKTMRGF